MSRIGKKPVPITKGVEVTIDGSVVKAKGPKGQLEFATPDDVSVAMEDGGVVVKPINDGRRARAMWGMARTRIANLIEGVSDGFVRKLELVGVGYRAQMQGKNLKLALGFSHDVEFPPPDGIEIKAPSQTSIEIHGIDKQAVGQVAANIRAIRPPEPFKGKGVRYAGERIRMKEGKKK